MIRHSKGKARKVVDAELRLLSMEEYGRKSEAALKHLKAVLLDLQEKQEIMSILSYRSLEKWREVDVTPIEKEFPEIKFTYVPADPDTELPAHRYDSILVPLYGFNSDGYRLGHGGGWYDRFLVNQTRAFKVGIGLETGRISFPIEPHDILLDLIITERGLETPQRKNSH